MPRPSRQQGAHPPGALAGFTLIEMMIAMAVVGVILGISLSRLDRWSEDQRAKAAARSVADLLQRARAGAIRTGSRHVVFFGNPGVADPSGNAVEKGGAWVPVLLIEDGPPAAANCAIDGGEILEAVEPVDDVTWGVSFATARVATDAGAAPFDPGGTWDGATFNDQNNAKISWMLFRPDGVPVPFVGAVGSCGAVGSTGRGGGAFYMTTGERDFAVVLSRLGGVRLHVWDRSAGGWSS